HCCRCDQVFSALDNLREPHSDEAWPESRFIDDFPEQQNLELPFDSPDEESRQEIQSSLTELLQALQITPEEAIPDPEEADNIVQLASDDERDPFEPIYIFDDPEMDSVQIGLDSQLHPTVEDTPDTTDEAVPATPQIEESVDPDTEPQIAEPHAGDPAPVNKPPFPIPDDLPALQPAETPPLSLEETLGNSGPSRRGTVAWTLSILLLLLLALGQLVWFGRDHLLQYPAGRQFLESACDLLLCQLPPRHAPDKLHVVSRAITSHPDQDNALQVMLILRNDADFSQAWPLLELSLLDRDGGLIARRSFHPEEYRDSTKGLLQPGIPQTLHLELEDPGDNVVGFQFDFH
ncbi:DUF3426 domain-containing protein, partial [Sedimenticola sp.]|uniref:DUF3426 domain-containing protein n=1 Tax=Sedimenticola sp. TaxID=1940285 RepID=UPI003D0BF2C6